MPVVNVHEAKTQLSRLLALVEAGDEVVMPAGGCAAQELGGWIATAGSAHSWAGRRVHIVPCARPDSIP